MPIVPQLVTGQARIIIQCPFNHYTALLMSKKQDVDAAFIAVNSIRNNQQYRDVELSLRKKNPISISL